MKKIIIGLVALTSISAFAGNQCVTSEGEIIKASPLSGEYGHKIEREDGSSVKANLINEDSVYHYVSKDLKTLKISVFKNLGLGTAKIDDKLVSVDCE